MCLLSGQPILVAFFRLESGREPVREWLRSLDPASKKAIGADIKTVQFAWPVGMSLIRKLQPDLWEIRSTITDGIARIFFSIYADRIVQLHGFVKKSQKTRPKELALAKRRLNTLRK